jgi:hypothetical protein
MTIICRGAMALLFCLLGGAHAAEPAPTWAEAAERELPDPAGGRPAPPALLGEALAGRWQGTLEYRDYGNERRVVLPTRASISGPSEALLAEFVYDDGPGKVVRSRDRWALAGASFRMEQAGAPLAVSSYRSGGGSDVALVALGTGSDNGVAVQVRMVLQRRDGQLRISRATQAPGQPWLLRHVYRLQPAP